MHRISPFARGRKISFTFDGRTVTGYEHESLAAAILAGGRRVLSRSLRFHRPRTVFCSTGECGWCAVEINGVPNVHACMLRCQDDLTVRSQNAWPSAERDIFGLLDLFNQFLPNSFYHHRFLQPRFMRQFYLRVIRYFTGLGRLSATTQILKGKQKASTETNLVIVGSGLAGMSAAVTAADGGARVILIDDRDAPGGSWRTRMDAPSVLNDLIAKVKTLPNLEYWSNSTCIGVYGPGILGVSTPEKVVTLHAKQIILAPGALDTLPLFVNNDVPGVISARLLERLVGTEGIAPGRRAVLWGAPASTEKIPLILQQAGIELVHHLEPSEAIVAVKGSKEVHASVVRDALRRTRVIPCDLIVLAFLQPRNELLAQAGGQLRWDESVSALCAQRDHLMQTNISGIRAVGAATSLADATRCQAEGRLAGLAALRDMGFTANEDEINLLAEQINQSKPENSFIFPVTSANGAGHICFCEDVREREIRTQADSPYSALELIKRRTAVVTGPCQGKFCLANAMRVSGYTTGSPTARPPAKPFRMKDLLSD